MISLFSFAIGIYNINSMLFILYILFILLIWNYDILYNIVYFSLTVKNNFKINYDKFKK